MTHGPLLCGTLMLDVDVRQAELGVALANHHLSIFATAYLYNALRQLELVDLIWPEMERIMELQVDPLFAGELTTKMAQM